MRAVIQRVSSASVEIDGRTVGAIGSGLLIFLGVTYGDEEAQADYLAAKCASLRIFRDDQDKMNLSVRDVGGSALVVSQFTLYGDCRKGNRPAFVAAARPDTAVPLSYPKADSYIRLLHTRKHEAAYLHRYLSDSPAPATPTSCHSAAIAWHSPFPAHGVFRSPP